jgi:methylthioribulose-1-phosphate dehydratase
MAEAPDSELETATKELIALAAKASARGWTPATSGNFSVRVDARRAVVTLSGRDKGALTAADVVAIDLEAPLPPGVSAEAPVHTAIYRRLGDARAVAHVHSVAATVLSRRHEAAAHIRVDGLEMLKALRGFTTHEARLDLRVYPNTQDMDAFARDVGRDIATLAPGWGLLLAGHGLYAWGTSPAEAWRHAEALDFLLTVRMHEESLPR